MTAQKHLKQIIRARMAKTAERYATARRQIVSSPDAASQSRIPTSIHQLTVGFSLALIRYNHRL